MRSVVALGVTLALLLFFVGYQPFSAQAVSGEKFDLFVYPLTTNPEISIPWKVDQQQSGLNMIALKGKNGFSGSVTVTASGLPAGVPDHYDSSVVGGYYCSSHCQAAPNGDFPFTLQVRDGEWTTLGPTLIAADAAPGDYTVTMTATGGGTTLQQAFPLKIVATTADPPAAVVANDAEFGATAYKLRLEAGQTKTVAVDVVVGGSGSVNVSLVSNLFPGFLRDITDTITGGYDQWNVTLAGGSRVTRQFTIRTSADTPNGTYEIILGTNQTDSTINATLGISLVVTGRTSSSPSTSTTTTTSPATTPATTTTPAAIPATTTTQTTTTTTAPSTTVATTTSETSTPTLLSSLFTPATETPIQTDTARLDEETIIRQQVTSQVLVPAALTGAAMSAVSFVTAVMPLANTAGNAAAGSALAGYLLLLWNGFLEGVGLRRRRYPWGTVFEAGTDQVVELAIVRLLTEEGKLLETRVTDRAGRFGFLAKPGVYRLEVAKAGYILAPARQAAGSRFSPVLAKPVIHIQPEDAVVRTNIPLERVEHQAGRSLLAWLGILHRPLLLMTVPIGLWNLAIQPTAVNGAVLAVMAFLITSEWLILTPRYFGTVSGPDHRPTPGVVLRLLRLADQKVVDTTVTDRAGRYSFLARSGQYQIRVASPGWHAPAWLETHIFTVKKSTGGIIAVWFRVEPASGEEGA